MKNSKKHIYLALAISSLLFASACKKHDDHKHDETDTSFPQITITQPVDMQTYKSGDSVYIKGSVTDNDLHEMKIEIIKDSDSSELFSESPTVHGMTSYTMNTFWLSGLSSGAASYIPATLKVTAEDHAGNKSTKKVAIRIFP